MSFMEGDRSASWRRGIGIAFGLGTQALFAVTVWHLFWFLRDGVSFDGRETYWFDAFLASQFAIVHSFLLHPTVRRTIVARGLPSAFYGCLFCTATCLGLLPLCLLWRASPGGLWEFHGWGQTVMRGGFYGSWIALLYSLSFTGLGYQTGWTPWWHWFRGVAAPRRGFPRHGIYAWFRHPVYLSFMGLIWFTPRMTWDHAILTGIWTVYIFIGSVFKDERLAHYLGSVYREYQSRVPGYPLMWFGPLGLYRYAAPTATDTPSSPTGA